MPVKEDDCKVIKTLIRTSGLYSKEILDIEDHKRSSNRIVPRSTTWIAAKMHAKSFISFKIFTLSPQKQSMAKIEDLEILDVVNEMYSSSISLGMISVGNIREAQIDMRWCETMGTVEVHVSVEGLVE